MTCIGCNNKIYRLATRDDGVHAVERCDTCSEHLTDDEAFFLSGKEGLDWINSGPGRGDELTAEPTRIRSREGVDEKHFWCVELKSPVHGRWIVIGEHPTYDQAFQHQKSYGGSQ